MNRRALMLGIAAFFWSARAFAQQPTTADQREIKEVNDRATAANLDQFRHYLSNHYLGIGNADPAWSREALRLCEDLADDYMNHFRKKGFNLTLPKNRLTVIALADPASFATYLGSKPEEAVGGVYDLENNRLTIFDNRARDIGDQQARANTVSLLHEATHQLTFNTGLLDREADVPLVISFEPGWEPTAKSAGRRDKPRSATSTCSASRRSTPICLAPKPERRWRSKEKEIPSGLDPVQKVAHERRSFRKRERGCRATCLFPGLAHGALLAPQARASAAIPVLPQDDSQAQRPREPRRRRRVGVRRSRRSGQRAQNLSHSEARTVSTELNRERFVADSAPTLSRGFGRGLGERKPARHHAADLLEALGGAVFGDVARPMPVRIFKVDEVDRRDAHVVEWQVIVGDLATVIFSE